jgi:hypothetical protein
MKSYVRLLVATVCGLVFLGLLTGAVYWLRSALMLVGYQTSDRAFLVVLLAVLGGGFGLMSQIILRLAKPEKVARSE